MRWDLPSPAAFTESTACLWVRGMLISSHNDEIPAVGLEPTLYCYNQILSLACLPFHHAGVAMEIFN